INAQGRVLVTQQQSMLTAERVSQARLETRRREFDEWLYNRDNRPTREDDRERVQRQELRRSRNDQPLSEIYSGAALNTLLAELQKLEGRGLRPAEIPPYEALGRHLNV